MSKILTSNMNPMLIPYPACKIYALRNVSPLCSFYRLFCLCCWVGPFLIAFLPFTTTDYSLTDAAYCWIKDKASGQCEWAANILWFDINFPKMMHCLFQDNWLQQVSVLRYSSDWKLSLRNPSCNIPLASSWHQEVRNHHIFCVASNDAALWITIKLTCFTLFEL